MIGKVVKLLTFIPWILYFVEIVYYRIAIIEKNDLDTKKYFKYLNKNFFTSLNIKELVLYFIFVAFMRYEKTLVLEILFPSIYVYLLIEFFMTLASDCKKIQHKGIMVLAVILITVLIGAFILYDHLYTTYNLMFIVSIMNSILIYVFSLIYKIPKKRNVD